MKEILLTTIAMSFLTACTNLLPTGTSKSDLEGAWELVSVETINPKGEISYPFYGRNPQGLIIYDPSGWMSVQIVSDPKPTVPKSDTRSGFRSAPIEERATAADGYYAYFGTYTVDTRTSTVTHHLKESLFPGERGEEVSRQYSIDNHHLVLVAKFREFGEEHQRRLEWQRLTDRSQLLEH